MKQEVKQGQTDYTVLILIRDTSGNAKTGLVFNSAGIDVSYIRVETDNDVVQTDGAIVDLVTPLLTDPHLDWGFLEVDAADNPGIYRLDIADGVFAAGAWSAVVTLICTGCEPSHLEFMLVPESPYVGVDVASSGGGTAPGAAGGLAIAGANAATTFATLSVTGQLDAGNVLVDGTTVLTGNTSIGGTFGITGAATLASLSVTGQLDAGSVLVDAGMDIVGALSANSLLIDTTTTLTGAVSTGAITSASLSVTGQLNAGNILVDAGVNIVGQLDMANFLCDTTFVVSGATTFTGNVGFGGTFDVTGASTLASLSVTGQLDAGNVIIDAGMDIVGALSANSLLIDTTTTLTGNVILSGTLGVAGITTFTGAVGMPAGLTVDITGNLSGSVGSLTGHTNQTADNNTILADANFGNAQLVRSTTPANKLDVSATGEAGLDFNNIKDAAGAHTLTNITVPTTTSVTNRITANTDQIEGGDATNAIRDSILDDATRFSGGNIDASVSSRGTADPGDAMTLSADAIKAVSYDETTAWPLKADDSGATQIARVGADGDTLEVLSDQIDLQATLAICTEARLAELDAANLPTDIADIPTVAEFNARSIVSADYVVVTDTIAGVTTVGTTTNLTNAAGAGDLTATMKTSVNTEVLDVLNTDTFAEPGQEVPTSTTTLVDKISYIYKFLRNKVWTTATDIEVYNDAGAVVDQKSTISDDGTTFKRSEFGSGP